MSLFLIATSHTDLFECVVLLVVYIVSDEEEENDENKNAGYQPTCRSNNEENGPVPPVSTAGEQGSSSKGPTSSSAGDPPFAFSPSVPLTPSPPSSLPFSANVTVIPTASTLSPARLPVRAYSSAAAPLRHIPGPAGVLAVKMMNANMGIVSPSANPSLSAVSSSNKSKSQNNKKKVALSLQITHESFTQGPWLAMLQQLDIEYSNDYHLTSTYFKTNVAYVLAGGYRQKVPQLLVHIKSFLQCDSDAYVTVQDPSGVMKGTLHQHVLDEYGVSIGAGAVIILSKVSVFSPSKKDHFLNITPGNVLHVFSPDTPIPKTSSYWSFVSKSSASSSLLSSSSSSSSSRRPLSVSFAATTPANIGSRDSSLRRPPPPVAAFPNDPLDEPSSKKSKVPPPCDIPRDIAANAVCQQSTGVAVGPSTVNSWLHADDDDFNF